MEIARVTDVEHLGGFFASCSRMGSFRELDFEGALAGVLAKKVGAWPAVAAAAALSAGSSWLIVDRRA